ncbi:hypothetical protein CK203_020664 [Vitis vinifera]|uniref:Protein kinase domain-containing protein n=1 Tax=Vitis vinifera TaxID=29760 RepID=A0A438FMB6_VITVI|nr:hypothetical protein CK203_020664 [Vitis vinifera]
MLQHMWHLYGSCFMEIIGGWKVTNVTPVSLLEVKVERYIKVIFGDETAAKKYDPVEMSQIPRIRPGLACSNDLELWIKYFGGLCDVWLLKIEFSLWYGGELSFVRVLVLGKLRGALYMNNHQKESRRVAPELLSSHSYSPMFTKKSDVYSFGVLLLELITGEKPSVTNLAEYVREKKRRKDGQGRFNQL